MLEDKTNYNSKYLKYKKKYLEKKIILKGGNYISKFGSFGSEDEQFNYPRGIGILTDNKIVVSDSNNHRIQIFNQDGTFHSKFGSQGDIGGKFNYPKGIGIIPGPDDKIVVADSSNNRIQIFNQDGTFISEFGRFDNEDRQFKFPEGIGITPDGKIVVSDQKNRIQIFNQDGTFISKFGSQGSANGKFKSPKGIGITPGPDGKIIVADSGNHRIQIFDKNGIFISKFGSQGDADGQFKYPKGICITPGPDGKIIVADNHRIQIFNQDGTFVSTFGSQGYANGQFFLPYGIGILLDGKIVVSDSSNSRIQIFSIPQPPQPAQPLQQLQPPLPLQPVQPARQLQPPSPRSLQPLQPAQPPPPRSLQSINKFGSLGSEDGKFEYPRGIGILPDGKIVVADSGNHRIQIFNQNGIFHSKFGSPGSEDGQFFLPYGIGILPDGKIVVTDSDNHRIQIFNQNGTFEFKFGFRGNANGQFEYPKGIGILPDGKIVVGDTYNKRIQIFNQNGTFHSKFGSQGSANGQFSFPLGIGILPDGKIVVADSFKNIIQIFNQDGIFVSKFGSHGNRDGKFKSPKGIGITPGPDGKIVVGDTDNHRIQIFNQDGTIVSKFGSRGNGDGKFKHPSGIGIIPGPDGKIVVADSDNHRIQIFSNVVSLESFNVVSLESFYDNITNNKIGKRKVKIQIKYLIIGNKKYYESIYNLLQSLPDYKNILKITFFNILEGREDSGVDANGLTKESCDIFMNQACKIDKVFKREYLTLTFKDNFDSSKNQLEEYYDSIYILIKQDEANAKIYAELTEIPRDQLTEANKAKKEQIIKKIKENKQVKDILKKYIQKAKEIITEQSCENDTELTEAKIKEQVINIQLEEKYTEYNQLFEIDKHNTFDIIETVPVETYRTASKIFALYIYNNCVFNTLANPYLLWTFYINNNFEKFNLLPLEPMLKLGSNLDNDEFPYGCVDETKFNQINECNKEITYEIGEAGDEEEIIIEIEFCDRDVSGNCIEEDRKIKLTDKNISNMRKYLIDEMRKKYSRRKELLKSIEQIFIDFLGNSKELLELKMLETVICGEQKLMLEDFFQYLRFNNKYKVSRNMTSVEQEAIKELITLHSEESKKKGEINVYLESLLNFITASKRISNKIKKTGISFNLVPYPGIPPINAHTCFNYIDVKETYLIDLTTKRAEGRIRESTLFEWLGPELLKNQLAQTFGFAG